MNDIGEQLNEKEKIFQFCERNSFFFFDIYANITSRRKEITKVNVKLANFQILIIFSNFIDETDKIKLF